MSEGSRLDLNNKQRVPVARGFGVVCTEPPPPPPAPMDTASFHAASSHVCALLLWEGRREDRMALKEI